MAATDRFLPQADETVTEHLVVAADSARTYAAIGRADISSDRFVGLVGGLDDARVRLAGDVAGAEDARPPARRRRRPGRAFAPNRESGA